MKNVRRDGAHELVSSYYRLLMILENLKKDTFLSTFGVGWWVGGS